jgi:hypothetical protein
MSISVAPSQQDIYNMSLGHITMAPVGDIKENSRMADACNLYWPQAVRDTLRGNKWPFASVVLPLSQSATYTPVNWTYAYVYPSACIKMWRVYNSTTDFNKYPKGEVFTEMYDPVSNVKIIVTNCAGAYGEYVTPIEDPTIFDSMFVSALCLKLASLISPSLINDPSVTLNMLKLFTSAISEAQRASSEEDATGVSYQQSQFLDARGGSTIDVRFQNGFSTSQ